MQLGRALFSFSFLLPTEKCYPGEFEAFVDLSMFSECLVGFSIEMPPTSSLLAGTTAHTWISAPRASWSVCCDAGEN